MESFAGLKNGIVMIRKGGMICYASNDLRKRRNREQAQRVPQ